MVISCRYTIHGTGQHIIICWVDNFWLWIWRPGHATVAMNRMISSPKNGMGLKAGSSSPAQRNPHRKSMENSLVCAWPNLLFPAKTRSPIPNFGNLENAWPNLWSKNCSIQLAEFPIETNTQSGAEWQNSLAGHGIVPLLARIYCYNFIQQNQPLAIKHSLQENPQ